MVANRGVRIWPDGHPETSCIEQWRCRFLGSGPISPDAIPALLTYLLREKFDLTKTENLYTFDGVPGYSSAEG
jgi:isocitrate dehydrogenase